MRDKNPSYWETYTNLQFTKHKLISEYLKGWFPKLGSWCGKILYVDTHAGRGKYETGKEGSPIIALKTFLDHRWRDKILGKCEVQFMFIEEDESNAKKLQEELQRIGQLPPKVRYTIFKQNAFKLLTSIADELEKSGSKLAPGFMFIDPYGFKVPCELLRRIKAHSRSELLITLIWRELDMAMQQKELSPGLKETIDIVFGGEEWENIKSIDDYDARGEATIQLLTEKIGAEWKTSIRMLGDNEKTRYFLLHLTNHEAGRDLMKKTVWKCCPENGYYVRKKDDPNQQYLIKPKPDLRELEKWLISKLKEKPQTWNELAESLRNEIWLNKHLWEIIKKLKKSEVIIAEDFSGKFSQKANPTFKLVKDQA